MTREEFTRMVFKPAIAEAKRIKRQHPNLKYTECVKRAWRTKRIMDLKKKYNDRLKKRKTTRKPRKRTTRKQTTRKTTRSLRRGRKHRKK